MAEDQSNSNEPSFLKKALTEYFWMILIAGILYFIVIGIYGYNFGLKLSQSQGDWGTFGDYVGGVLNPALSLLGLIAVILSLHYNAEAQRTNAEALRIAAEARTDRASDLFQTFRYDHMKRARDLAWRARQKWYADKSYRDRLTRRIYQGYNEERLLTPDESAEFTAIYDMLEFYSMLAVHKGGEEEIKNFGFYYSWWRGFLYELRDAHMKEYEELCTTDDEKRQFPKPQWVDHLEILDKRFDLPKYEKDKHPIDKKFPSSSDEQ